MSEVKSFWCHEASNILCVSASDFDNVTRLFLDAAERAVASERREKDLQQRLTAADERADVLETALAGMLFAFDDGVGREWSEDLLDFARKLTAAKEFKAALKPAEVKCKTCNGTRIVSDGAMYCSSGGIPFECGPIECVKDCPDCSKP